MPNLYLCSTAVIGMTQGWGGGGGGGGGGEGGSAPPGQHFGGAEGPPPPRFSTPVTLCSYVICMHPVVCACNPVMHTHPCTGLLYVAVEIQCLHL